MCVGSFIFQHKTANIETRINEDRLRNFCCDTLVCSRLLNNAPSGDPALDHEMCHDSRMNATVMILGETRFHSTMMS